MHTVRNGVALGTSWFSARGALDSARAGPDTTTTRTRYATDSLGRVVQVTDLRGHTSYAAYQWSGFRNTDSTYGEADLPAHVVGARVFYDSYGRVVATRDANLNRDTTAYVA